MYTSRSSRCFLYSALCSHKPSNYILPLGYETKFQTHAKQWAKLFLYILIITFQSEAGKRHDPELNGGKHFPNLVWSVLTLSMEETASRYIG
jgi:hypothetical protein